MPRPILKAAQELDVERDAAKAIAESIVANIALTDVLTNPEDTLKTAREQLEAALLAQRLPSRAYLLGKRYAWEIIARTPPRTPIMVPGDALDPSEVANLTTTLEAWRVRMQQKNERLFINLQEIIEPQQRAGMSQDRIVTLLEQAWENNGRITWWQREFISAAVGLITEMDFAGQEAGFIGTTE